MIRAAVLGGTGYGGMELLRLLLGHPEIEVTALTSRTEEGPVSDRYPHLAGFTDLSFTREDAAVRAQLAQENDLLFFAKPHGVSASELPPVLDSGSARIVDLSGDFRLVDSESYPTWYDFEHPHPEVLGHVVYGLAECGQREAIRAARVVANPGCHATATLMAMYPAARADAPTGRIAVSSVTGSSGSGSRPKAGTHHPERFMNFKAYRPLEHQHLPEVLQVSGVQVPLDFVPHSAPFARGIHVTALIPVRQGLESAAAAAYARHYADEPFVRLRAKPPEVRAVVGTNLVDVHVTVGTGVLCVTVAIDNLGKGMAGTAVQNANLMFGLDERAGLDRPGAGL